uniref:Uncharacterized protein n=1 Tax=Streptomyces sp. FR1 TaxID=349971 RepID=V9YZT5_9ACTN|nr:hypothetical protein [Streptomyces sp. FR1]AHE38835.1 Hypothetical protein pFRL3_58 [Streptomyces sp. FR1]
MAGRITPASLATAAKLNRIWVKKATELGLISPASLDGEDVIVVQVLAVVDQLVWPGNKRSRSQSRTLEVGLSLVVNTARNAISDTCTTRDTVLWVMQDKVPAVTNTLGERAQYVIDVMGRSCAYAIPLGEWIAALPNGYEVPATRRLATPDVAAAESTDAPTDESLPDEPAAA